MNEKVMVVSTVNAQVGITVADLKLRKEWKGKGAKVPIDKETLTNALYDPSVKYMFDHGILYVEDLQQKKDLELEPEDATEPVNIIVLNDAQKKRYLTVAPLQEFKTMVQKLSKEQRIDLAQYAIQNQMIDIERAKIIKAACGIDILQAVVLEQKAKEE